MLTKTTVQNFLNDSGIVLLQHLTVIRFEKPYNEITVKDLPQANKKDKFHTDKNKRHYLNGKPIELFEAKEQAKGGIKLMYDDDILKFQEIVAKRTLELIGKYIKQPKPKPEMENESENKTEIKTEKK